MRWPQWSLVQAIKGLFPEEWTKEWEPPMLEDLVNAEPFTIYPEYLEEMGLDADREQPPTCVSSISKGWRAAAEQCQKGNFFSKGAVHQVVSLGLEDTDHFQSALDAAANKPFPLNTGHIRQDDLSCAARYMVRNRKDLPAARTRLYKPVVALA